MDKYEKLNIDERATILWEEGTIIATTHSAALYKLRDFYVEVILGDSRIEEVTPFRGGERLEKYLSKIKLP